MEARAMKEGRKAKDNSLIKNLYEIRKTKAAEMESSGNTARAFQEYLAIASDFDGLLDVSADLAKGSELGSLDTVKQAISDDQRRDKEETEFRMKFASVVQSVQRAADQLPSKQKIDAFLELERLKKAAEDQKDSEEGRHARRLLEAVYVQTSFYLRRNFMEHGEYRKAGLMLDISASIHPEDPDNWYLLACTHALTGEKEKAIQALKSAVEHGFNDVSKLESEYYLNSIREEKEFKKILQKVKK
jgi:predicted Zn-dependent protease